ncbi:DNA polymerase III subunit beta, partial [bacterium]|nr:DNA polymerase III subunit beta [bacterium]
TLPILNSVLIECSDSLINIRSSDLESSITTHFKGNVIQPGAVAIEGKLLLSFISETPSDEIEITVDESYHVTITTDVGSYNIGGQNPDEFPSKISVENVQTLSIESSIFSRIIQKTTFMASKEDMKPSLTGILFRSAENQTIAVATDGHRLIKFLITKNKDAQNLAGDILIPARFLNLIAGYLPSDGVIEWMVGEKFVSITIGDTEFISRLIVERYPDFEAVIPTNNEKEFVIVTNDILASIKRISLFANKNNNQISFHLTNDHLTIETKDSEMQRSAVEDFEVEYQNEEIIVGYNCFYLKEIIQRVDTEKVKFSFNTAISAGLITPIDQPENEEITMLLMPIRLSE